MSRTAIVIAAGLALAVTLPAVQAQAQAPRTFVSAAGSDSNPCSFAAPCRHFQAAVDATSDGGEVDALDPAGYSPVTISRGITIEGQGWSYIAPPTGGAAITINGGSGNIYINGVSLNGVGVTNANGIQFNSGTSLTVRNSVIRNFSATGIIFTSTAVSSELSVSNTRVSDSGNGIELNNNNNGTMTGVLDHVAMENNTGKGLAANGNSGAVNVSVSDCVSVNNGTGILANAVGAGAYVAVRRCNISHNGTGVLASNNFANIRLAQTVITANSTGWNTTGSGFPLVNSTSDNLIDNNASGNGAPGSIGYK